MKKNILIFTVLISLRSFGNDELSKFADKKIRQVDSLSTVYNEDVTKAQKEFEKALMEADKKYQKEIEKIEKEQQKIIDKNIEFKKIDIVEPKTKKK